MLVSPVRHASYKYRKWKNWSKQYKDELKLKVLNISFWLYVCVQDNVCVCVCIQININVIVCVYTHAQEFQ